MALALLFFSFFSGQKVVQYFWSNHKGRHFVLLFSRFFSDIQAAPAVIPKELSKFLNDLSTVSVFTEISLTARFTSHVFYVGWTNLLITGGMCKATPPLPLLLFFERRGRLYRGYPIYGRMRYMKNV